MFCSGALLAMQIGAGSAVSLVVSLFRCNLKKAALGSQHKHQK
jgi:hypothetical protein